MLGDRYQIIKAIGKGGMGTVYLAEDMNVKGKQRAVKELIRKTEEYQQFIDEADILVKLNHPYLPNILDYYPPNDEGYSYLVMDYINGQTLQELFYQQQLSTDKVIKYAVQICDLFQYIHHEREEPIVYRDLKPSNVMIDEQDNVRLIDFGIARNYKEGQYSDTVQIGTVGFAAPEQFENTQSDHRTDLYSLGAMMYYLLSGGKYYSFTQQTLDQFNSNMPQTLNKIVHKLLMYQPQDRYQMAIEVKRKLEGLSYSNHSKPIISPKKLRWISIAFILALLSSGGYFVVDDLMKPEPKETAVGRSAIPNLLDGPDPAFAARDLYFNFFPPSDVVDSYETIEWRIYNDNQQLIHTIETELNTNKMSAQHNFASRGDYTIEIIGMSQDKEDVISSTLVSVVPPPKVWFDPIIAKGDKLLVNRTVEFRVIRDNNFHPTEWFWGYNQQIHGWQQNG
jgi:serine/threonine protein kinase